MNDSLVMQIFVEIRYSFIIWSIQTHRVFFFFQGKTTIGDFSENSKNCCTNLRM